MRRGKLKTSETSEQLLPPVAQEPPLLPVPIAALFRLALIVQFFAPRQCQLQLRTSAIIEINPERDKGHALSLDRSNELVGFPLVKKKLSRAARFVVEPVRLEIFRNVCVDKVDLAILLARIGLRDICFSLPKRFYLGTA